jgi:hypothetical protein
MHWEVLIVPLIALGVWILGTLFRSEEEKRTQAPVRRPQGARVPGGGRPVTDLDRFLEEARRRREAAEKRLPVPPDRSDEPVVVRPTPPRKTPEARPVRPSERLQPPARPVPTARPVEAVPVAIPVATPVPTPAPAPPPAPRPRLAEVVLETVAQPVPALAVPEPPPPLAMPETSSLAAVVPRVQSLSPALAQAYALLRSPQTAAAAFVLREILDRPLCQRRRRS